MNEGKGYCDHEWEDYSCVCQLEAIIEKREKFDELSKLVGLNLNSDKFRQAYYTDVYLFNVMNILMLIHSKHEEACKDLKWACSYIMGDTEETQEQAGWRAYSISKKLRNDGDGDTNQLT